MWEGNPGYQLDVAIAMHEYECVCMCVYVFVLAAGDLEHSAARCNNPQAELDSEPMSRLRLSKDVAKATTPTHQAVSGTGPAHWAGSAACNNQQQQRAAGARSGSVQRERLFGRPLNGRAVFKMAVKLLTLNTARSLAAAAKGRRRGNRGSAAGGKLHRMKRGRR